MRDLKVGQKILLVVGAIYVLFALGLAVVIGTTSFNNLTAVKQSELQRMSQILASQINDMEHNGVITAKSFEESDPIATEIKQITNLGPYYADPGSYFPADFMGPGNLIEDADKVFVFQSQLKLIQLLQSAQRLNDLSSVSFYMLSPFNVVRNAEPALSLRVDQDTITVMQFSHKGNLNDSIIYQVPVNEFTPPAPDYFDISSAYSAPPEQFYAENKFKPVSKELEEQKFPLKWQETNTPHSEIVLKNGIPIIQTWYPVKVSLPNPVTWEQATVTVGLALIEQRLDVAAIGLLKGQLKLDVGLARDDQLLINSLTSSSAAVAIEPIALQNNQTVNLNNSNYYYDLEPIKFSDGSTANLEAMVFSPISELELLTQTVRTQIVFVSLAAIVFAGIIVYLSLRYMVNRPLGALMKGVQAIAVGDLNRTVAAQSRDELGQLAIAFNGMAAQLRDLVGSLEQRVAARTHRLEIVASLGERLSAILDIDQLLTELVTRVKESFDYYHTHVYLLDSEQVYLVMTAGYGEAGAIMKAQGHRIRRDAQTSLVARAARAREIVRVDNVREDKNWLPNPLLPNTYSEMAVPIIWEGQVVGVLDVQSDKIAGLDEGDASVLRSLANQVAVALNNAQLFKQTQTATAEAEALNRRLTREAWQNIDQRVQSTGYLFSQTSVKPAPAEWLPAMEQAVQYKQLTQDFIGLNGNGDNEPTATMAIPLMLRGEVIGVVGVERSTNRPWSEDELTAVQSITEQVSLALDAARLARDTERSAWRDRVVSESTAQVWSSAEIEDVMRAAVAQLGDKLRASEVVIRLGTAAELAQE